MDLTKYGVSADNKLLVTAFTHSSYSKENSGDCYERLEFLGDAVLQLIMSDYFYKKSNLSEGEMTKIRASYVCEEALFAYAKKCGIMPHIKLGNGFDKVNQTIAADVFEAVIAAIYINAGFNNAKKFVMDAALDFIKEQKVFMHDYKSHLQELVQTNQKSVTYKLINETGPAHDKNFTVEVIVEDIVYGKGSGKSKKEAEQNAAADAIKKKAGI